MSRPIFTVDLISDLHRSLITTGKWTKASTSWTGSFTQSHIRIQMVRFYMMGIVYGGL